MGDQNSRKRQNSQTVGPSNQGISLPVVFVLGDLDKCSKLGPEWIQFRFSSFLTVLENTSPCEGAGILLASAFDLDKTLPVLENTLCIKGDIRRVYYLYIIFRNEIMYQPKRLFLKAVLCLC